MLFCLIFLVLNIIDRIFMDKSLKDIDRFKKQKVRDINEVMENYVKMQYKVNKLVSEDCFVI